MPRDRAPAAREPVGAGPRSRAAPVPVVTVPGPPDIDPAMVYLAAKPSEAGRRGLERSLARAAEILTGGLATSCLVVNLREVGYQHVQALLKVLVWTMRKPPGPLSESRQRPFSCATLWPASCRLVDSSPITGRWRGTDAIRTWSRQFTSFDRQLGRIANLL